MGPGGFPRPDGAATDRAAATAEVGWEMGVHLKGGEREEAGFEPMETYIWRRQNMVAKYIAMRKILDLCEAEERKRGGVGKYAVVGTGGN